MQLYKSTASKRSTDHIWHNTGQNSTVISSSRWQKGQSTPACSKLQHCVACLYTAVRHNRLYCSQTDQFYLHHQAFVWCLSIHGHE